MSKIFKPFLSLFQSANKVKLHPQTNILLDNYLYEIKARNSCVGIFRSSSPEIALNLPGFEIARSKMGRLSLHFEILHTSHPIYGTAKPIKAIEYAPIFNNEKQKLDYLLAWRDKIDPSYSADDKRISEKFNPNRNP